MRRSTIGLAFVLVAVTGCGFVESLIDPPVYVDLEIHNRTLDDLVYENAYGQRVEVQACESVRAEGFSLDTVSVRAPGGYVRAFGAADPAFAGREMHLVELPARPPPASRSSDRHRRICRDATGTRRRSRGRSSGRLDSTPSASVNIRRTWRRRSTVPAPNFDVIVSLAKRRGFVFASSEIYGGMQGFWDWGPLGVELKNNVKAAWWRHMVTLRDDVVGIDAAIIMNPRVWEASGHVAGFSDPMVDCRSCKLRFRADDLKGPPSEIACPNCGNRGTLTEPRQFNLMFRTHVGPVEDSASVAYLRPETAQAMFVQFDNVATSMRRKLPFGIAQQGRSFRNEITPGNFIFRLREFEQMEMEFFVNPRDEDTWFAYWVDARHRWWTDVMGIGPERLRLRPHEKDELSHYSKQTTDIEYEFPIGWSELEGVADRTDFDLKAHATASGRKLEVFDETAGEHLVPYVIEPAMGVERAVLTVLVDGYAEDQLAKETRVVLRIRPELAPVKAAVLPLLRNRPELVERARRLTADIKPLVAAMYDDTASIGKLYRRQDEIGTPFCVTVDPESLEDGAATIRERDSMTQERVTLELIPQRIANLVAGRATWEGTPREATPE